jgi:hypothetical protein
MEICHRTVPEGSSSTGPWFGREWLAFLVGATSARKINSENERKMIEYKGVRVGIAYSNCTVGTVHIGNSVH